MLPASLRQRGRGKRGSIRLRPGPRRLARPDGLLGHGREAGRGQRLPGFEQRLQAAQYGRPTLAADREYSAAGWKLVVDERQPHDVAVLLQREGHARRLFPAELLRKDGMERMPEAVRGLYGEEDMLVGDRAGAHIEHLRADLPVRLNARPGPIELRDIGVGQRLPYRGKIRRDVGNVDDSAFVHS